jgi:hypothetical protein
MGEHYGLGSLITDDLPHGWVTLVCSPVAESGPGKRNWCFGRAGMGVLSKQ